MSENKLVLIDGHALAYRQFFGLPIEGFTTKTGEPTNATFGFTGELLNIILRKNPPKYLAVSFDVGKTFRDDWFPEYKGTREKMPDELRLQIERIKKVVQAFNIPILAMDGYEADDVLGTLARIVKPMGVPVHILTGDRDLLQLVNENTTVELPKGRFNRGPQVYDTIQSVVDKLGVRPDQVVDYKAIVGDSSDNIPGVKGVGEKTAVKLLGQYDTLDVIYENLEEIQARYSNKLRDHKETAYLSQKLARIVTDVPIDFELAACEAQDFDPKPVLDIFRELEFQTHTQKLRE
ncbi:MAG: 5'-3' exonuclease H3TH domain-containing protein, partial [Chloroflexota bacterium]